MEVVQSGTFVTPGERLGQSDDYECGAGTTRLGQHILATIVGQVNLKGKEISVVRDAGTDVVVPHPGDIVTCKLTKLTPQAAYMDILCVDTTPLLHPFSGIVRVQDVRAVGETVELSKCFRPGDVVRAEVLSLGDARQFYLSTAKNELGVVYAESEAGGMLIPVSWQEMQCSKTRAREFRKVAKVTE